MAAQADSAECQISDIFSLTGVEHLFYYGRQQVRKAAK